MFAQLWISVNENSIETRQNIETKPNRLSFYWDMFSTWIDIKFWIKAVVANFYKRNTFCHMCWNCHNILTVVHETCNQWKHLFPLASPCAPNGIFVNIHWAYTKSTNQSLGVALTQEMLQINISNIQIGCYIHLVQLFGHIISDSTWDHGGFRVLTSDPLIQATQPGVISSQPVSKKPSSTAC